MTSSSPDVVQPLHVQGSRAGRDSLSALQELIEGYRVSQALYVVSKLAIADLLVSGPVCAADLARATRTQAEPLGRVLRALASVGVFQEDDDSRFGLTPLSTWLRTDQPGSLRFAALLLGEAEHAYQAFGDLLHTVTTGEPGFDHIFGMCLFDRLGQTAEATALFQAAMRASKQRRAADIVGAYDFAQFGKLVDVGGGQGTLLTAILTNYPTLRGVLFDELPAIQLARRLFHAEHLVDRCDLVVGDFFANVPPAGDGYLLSAVLHDWDDRRATRILLNCRAVIPNSGRLVLVEYVLSRRAECSPLARRAALADLNMLALLRGRERTEAEYTELLAVAGFRLIRIIPTADGPSLLECVPVSLS